jgi:hypothetical protein
VLSVRYVPAPNLPFPPGPRPTNLPLTLQVALPDIPRAIAGENLFADPATIPVRRVAVPPDQTRIGMALRGRGGSVSIVLTAPDGRTATLRRTLR